MEEATKAKLSAAFSVAVGVGRIASGAALATGHGLLGSYMRRHHMMGQAAAIAKGHWQAGTQSIAQGLEEWKSADRK